ncbi:MAG: triphosphoribosyl-dephospho-CoA synthase [Caldiserica bacterium]|jgi:triphosphoribosyl-dephospho-CoA synthase|nr:triphosphoribosyl-dephospho-CoA synthase [Caldisericota bacterium]MDH7562023.1 triphosphoribosyl-dephospho-CoA synthase [Caldisericota bacterium]
MKRLLSSSKEEIADYVMLCGQLASIMEVSAGPKPGSVSKATDLPVRRAGTYEHFLTGAVAIGPTIREAALRGIRAGEKKLKMSNIRIGNLIKQGMESVRLWHLGGDTHSGPILLFIPIAAASGKTFAEKGTLTLEGLEENTNEVISSTTSHDAVDFYQVMRTGCSPEELGRISEAGEVEVPDIFDESAESKIISQGITLYEAMKACTWDEFAQEWANGLKSTCFRIGYPTLINCFRETGNINTATVGTFLTILSSFEHGDPCIARWVGLKNSRDIREAVNIGRNKAREISARAKEILKLGGLKTSEGTRALLELDHELSQSEGELYPATAADFTAATLFIAFLLGLRF